MRKEFEMKPAYTPILRIKAGELTALKNLTTNRSRQIMPLFDIPQKKAGTSTQGHLDNVVDQLTAAWNSTPFFLDAYSWIASAATEGGEHVMSYVTTRLGKLEENVVAIVGYDRWDDDDYRTAIVNLSDRRGCQIGIRLDSDGIEDASDQDYFRSRISDILDPLNQNSAETKIVVDFGDMTQISITDAISRADKCLSILKQLGFSTVIIAGSSMPPIISLAVGKPDASGYRVRKEMLVWRALVPDNPRLLLGDYGVRSPRAQEDIIAPDTNGKIRYTIDNKYFIARGHSLRRGSKGAQYYELAQSVLESEHYMGREFSWGDQKVADCANKLFKGNATTWIAIDSNHHIASVLAEVFETTQQHDRIA
jgi:hypothetical protein